MKLVNLRLPGSFEGCWFQCTKNEVFQKLQIRSHLLKTALMENVIFEVVFYVMYGCIVRSI